MDSNMAEDDFELERLRAECAQEKQMKEMIDESVKELESTCEELDRRVGGIDDESNEWKTRYETQSEMNQQLERQHITLYDRVSNAKQTIKEQRVPKALRTYDNTGEVSPHYVKQLEKQRGALECQLRDLEWKLDQESKAYHKANEERKQYSVEINAAKGQISQNQQKTAAILAAHREVMDSPRNVNGLGDHRIIDPSKGPIRKTAAVKTLPRLN